MSLLRQSPPPCRRPSHFLKPDRYLTQFSGPQCSMRRHREDDAELSDPESIAPTYDDRNPTYDPFYHEVMHELCISKRKGWSLTETCSPGAVLKDAGRFYFRTHGPFLPIFHVISLVVNLHDDDDPVATVLEMPAFKQFVVAEIVALLATFADLCEKVLFMGMLLDDLRKSPTGIFMLSHFLDAHARFARSDDLGALRYDSMQYIEDVTLRDGKVIRYMADNQKTYRSFKDPATARLLCPHQMLDQYDDDPELFHRKVQEGNIRIRANDFPTFLYADGQFDLNNMDAGLCMGEYLVRCFHHVYMGKCTAMSTPTWMAKGGCKPISELNGMMTVTPRSIAYIAVLARFILNDQDGWSANDNKFIGADFYKNIINLFDDTEWAAATLRWWNLQVFGCADSDTDDSDNDDGPGGNQVASIAAQHAARQKKQAAERHYTKMRSPYSVASDDEDTADLKRYGHLDHDHDDDDYYSYVSPREDEDVEGERSEEDIEPAQSPEA
ncbi:hypothetical protein A0H81_06542 [Grifola frondosa]|uniref:Uncharacterized protein n=1 Tax=Grifola frondosa TaxID=5627 RepID=A0A1C7MA45_GRIFR|nr:hypothetical protein A0H81_06542 [Grifola frondosa]